MFKKFFASMKKKRAAERELQERRQLVIVCPECGRVFDSLTQSGICPHPSRAIMRNKKQ